jgi:hypothetical protein
MGDALIEKLIAEGWISEDWKQVDVTDADFAALKNIAYATQAKKYEAIINVNKRLGHKKRAVGLAAIKLKGAHKRISWILGQSIYEHDLVKGHGRSIDAIIKAKNIKEINKILEKRYNETHTKKISLPGQGRAHYKKYIGENHPDFKNF